VSSDVDLKGLARFGSPVCHIMHEPHARACIARYTSTLGRSMPEELSSGHSRMPNSLPVESGLEWTGLNPAGVLLLPVSTIRDLRLEESANRTSGP